MSLGLSHIDFFVVGSQRCGTTWIDKVLRSTGLVSLPKNKQTYYYDRNHHHGRDWYTQQFTDCDSHILRGEIATGYCLSTAIERLYSDYPDAKIILVAREPVDRAYSNFSKRRDDYVANSFGEALEQDDDLIKRGLYGEMLDGIYARFPHDQVMVMYFEDLMLDPQKFAQQLLEFVGLDYDIPPGFYRQAVNSSRLEGLVRVVKRYKLYFFVNLLKKMGLTEIIRRFILWSKRFDGHREYEISPDIVARIELSNQKLARYTQRDCYKVPS
jgi:hypothetical protein